MRWALVLEDSATARVAASQVFREAGFRVVCVRSIVAARGACQGTTFDVALIDCAVLHDERQQQRGDGLAFAKELSTRRLAPKLIVWSVSDHADAASRLGASFIQKDGRGVDAIAAKLREIMGSDAR